MDEDDRLAAACARLAREKGWPAEKRERLEGCWRTRGAAGRCTTTRGANARLSATGRIRS